VHSSESTHFEPSHTPNAGQHSAVHPSHASHAAKLNPIHHRMITTNTIKLFFILF